MNKWPKEWIDVIERRLRGLKEAYNLSFDTLNSADCYLEDLKRVGALKDPPKPREIWWCPKCEKAYEIGDIIAKGRKGICCGSAPIKMREVIDES